MSQGTQSIDRAAQVLVHVLETEEPPTVGGLSTRLGLPKSTASRLVGALERQGLIRRDGGGGQLVPGAVLQRYARRETGDAELVERASEALDRLAQASGETINVGVPSLGAVQLLGQRDSRHFLGSPNWVGRRVPAHGSALGKVFYAYRRPARPVRAARVARSAHGSHRRRARARRGSREGLRGRRRGARARPLGGGVRRARRVRRRCRRAQRLRPDGQAPAGAARTSRTPPRRRGAIALRPAWLRRQKARCRMTQPKVGK